MPWRTLCSGTGAHCFVLSMPSVSPFLPTLLPKRSGGAGRGSPRCAGQGQCPQTTGTRRGFAACANPRQPAGSGMALGTWPCQSGVSHRPTVLVMQRLARPVVWGRGVAQGGCCSGTPGWVAGAKQSMEKGETETAAGCAPESRSPCGAVPVPTRGRGLCGSWGAAGPGVTGAPRLASCNACPALMQ